MYRRHYGPGGSVCGRRSAGEGCSLGVVAECRPGRLAAPGAAGLQCWAADVPAAEPARTIPERTDAPDLPADQNTDRDRMGKNQECWLSRGGAVPTPTPSSELLIDSDSDSGSDGTLPWPNHTIERKKLKESDQGLYYRKCFKSLSFIAAPILARRVIRKGDIPENFTEIVFGPP